VKGLQYRKQVGNMTNRRRRVQFIIPPSKAGKKPDRVFGCNYALFFQHNIFLLYPAALLSTSGYEVQVTDCLVENKSVEDVIQNGADVHVFYSVFLSRKDDLACSKIIEQERSIHTPIIYMGSDPTFRPENYLQSANRFVVRGEPEYTLKDLLDHLDEEKCSVPGVSWYDKNTGNVIHNGPRRYIEDLDSLPFPDRSLLQRPYEYYNAKFRKLPTTTLSTSRGCAYRCHYCVPNSLSFARELEWKRWYQKKPPVTKRSPENILAEVRDIHEKGYGSIFILDDQFIWGRERTLEILRGLKQYEMEISVLARPDMITDQFLCDEMAAAGIRHVDLGIESFHAEILEDIRKDLKIETIHKAIEYLKESDIHPEVNVLFGCSPLETEETMLETIQKVESLKVDIIHPKICAPFPGTDFYEMAKKNGWMVTPEYIPIDTASESLISYEHLPKEKLIEYTRLLYKKHYFNRKYILRQLLKIRSMKELQHKFRTALKMRKNIFRSH